MSLFPFWSAGIHRRSFSFYRPLAQLRRSGHVRNGRAMVRRAFDLGITHFDLANNYGPPPGSAEENFGRIFRDDFSPIAMN